MEILTLRALEIKADSEGKGQFAGIAATYGDQDRVSDVISKGAFTNSIKTDGNTRPVLWQHIWEQPIGKTTIADESKGLGFDAQLNHLKVQQAGEAYDLIQTKVINAVSIGYVAVKWEYEDRKDAGMIRHLNEVDLWEISPVTFPANRGAKIVSVKADADTKRNLEKALRDAGCSRNEAKAILSDGFKGFNSLRDAGEEAETKGEFEKWLEQKKFQLDLEILLRSHTNAKA
jgi:HK97 family phage prohead protease